MADNPFEPPETLESTAPLPEPPVTGDTSSRRIQIKPLDRLSNGKALLGDQYMLFVGICLVGFLVASAVPFAILLGPMACGMHLCVRDRAYGRKTKFDQLFKGFDYFMPSLIASLSLMVASFIVMTPMVLIMFAGMLGAIAVTESNGGAGPLIVITMIPVTLLIMAIAMLVYIPFLFSYSLIVDQKMEGWDAVKASWSGAKQNFWGLAAVMFIYSLIGTLCIFACYLPFFFFLPIQLAALYSIYRDIFPNASDAHPPRDAAVMG